MEYDSIRSIVGVFMLDFLFGSATPWMEEVGGAGECKSSISGDVS